MSGHVQIYRRGAQSRLGRPYPLWRAFFGRLVSLERLRALAVRSTVRSQRQTLGWLLSKEGAADQGASTSVMAAAWDIHKGLSVGNFEYAVKEDVWGMLDKFATHTKRVPKCCLFLEPTQSDSHGPQNARNQWEKQSEGGCVGSAPSLRREPQAPGPRAPSF